ncbi:MAG: ANTAR domain-containing protein [Chloroflexi bacterium]|nr:ANTAR domain-containing protein [Chloroflexota bacterium]
MAFPRVLVVDEDPGKQSDLQDLLRSLGIALIERVDAAGAVTRARAQPPGLIVIDRLAEKPRTISVVRDLSSKQLAPVVACSEREDRDFVGQVLAAGAAAVILRPFDGAVVETTIRVALFRWGEWRKLRESLHRAREALQARGLVERAKGILMGGEKNLTEKEAHRLIQKAAMDEQKSRRQIAEAIILNHKVTRGR